MVLEGKDPKDRSIVDLKPAPPPVAGPSQAEHLTQLNTGAGAPRSFAPSQPTSDFREATAGVQAAVSQRMRETAGAAFALHAGQRYPQLSFSGDFGQKMADRWFELYPDDPIMFGALADDAHAIAALTDSQVAEKIAKNEDLSQFSDVWDSIVEVAFEVGATDEAFELIGQQSDALKGQFTEITRPEAVDILTKVVNPEGSTEFGSGTIQGSLVGGVLKLFGQGGAWSYDPNANLIAITIGDQDLGFRPRDTFKPEDQIDVMAEVIYALEHGELLKGDASIRDTTGLVDLLLESADAVGAWADGNPAVGWTLDKVWDTFSFSGDGPFGPELGPIDRAQLQLDAEKEAVLNQKQGITPGPTIAMAGVPFEALIADLAGMLIRDAEEQGIALSNKDALELSAEAIQDPQTRSDLRSEFWEVGKDTLIAQLEAQLDDTSAVRRATENTLGGVLNVFEAYDSVTQQIGLHVIGPLAATIEGGAAFFDTGDIGESFNRFGAAIERIGESSTAAEFFGLDVSSSELAQGFGDGLNLAVGIGFDPLNYVLPGAKGARALFRKSLTNPKYAAFFVRQGGVRQITRQIAEDTGRVALGNVFYMAGEGMSDDGIRALAKLAADPNATVDAVEKVILHELPNTDGVGWFLGGGPNRAIRHGTIDGVGRIFESLGAGKINDGKVLDRIFDMTTALGRTRSFDLGENMALTEFADLVMTVYPNDPDLAMQWFLKAVDASSGASRTERVGSKVLLRQKAGDKARAVGRHRGKAREEFDIRGARTNRDAAADSLRKVDALDIPDVEKDAIRTSLRRQVRNFDDAIANAETRLATYEASAREANKTIAQATMFEGDMAVQPSRASMAEVFRGFYDDVATQLNEEYAELASELGVDELVPIVKGKDGRPKTHKDAPDVPVRDWSQLTGTRRGAANYADDLKITQGLSIDNADELEAIGAFDRMQRLIAPISPYELMAFRKIRTQNSAMWERWMQSQSREVVSKVTTGMKMAFGLNLLLNPITMAKITLDETLRFFATTGALGPSLRATTAGLPAAGALRTGVATGTRSVTRGLGEIAPALRKLPGWKTLENAKGVWASNPWALQYMRGHEGFLSSANFQWISKSSPGVSKQAYIQQAERWVNGTLMNDDIFRAYATYLPDARELGALADNTYPLPESFARWWDEGDGANPPGRAHAKTSEFVVGTGPDRMPVPVDAQFAWNTIQRSYNDWLTNLVDDGQRHVIRRRLIEAVADRGQRLDIVTDAHLLQAIKQVPGLASEGGLPSQAVGKIFNGGFGNPSARRSGVFFEHFYDEAHQIYSEAYTNKGRLITKEMLVAEGFDEGAALEMLAHGSHNATVRRLMDETGAVTTQQIEAHAARYASLRADDLMYRFTAGSLAGQGVEAGLMFPFARAQMDFLSWWSDHLTRPMQLRGGLQEALNKVGMGGAVDAVQSIPINVRAWAKYAHLNAAQNNELQSPLDDAIDKLTFFPFRWSNEFFLDVLPQAGPLPSWMIDAYAAAGILDDEAMDAIATFLPALEYNDATDGWFDGMLDGIYPSSRRSLRDGLGGALRGVSLLQGKNPEEWPEGLVPAVYNWLQDNRVPAATNDLTAHAAAIFLRDNVFNPEGLDAPGSEEWNDAVNALSRNAAFDANQREVGQDFRDRLDPMAASGSRDYAALISYERMITSPETFALLNQYGILSGSDLFELDGTPRVLDTYERYLAGEASREDKAYLADALSNIFFKSGDVLVAEAIPDFSVRDLLILENPELAENLIAKSQCSGASIRSAEHRTFNSKYCNPQTGRLQNVPPGPTGTDLIAKARQNGWTTARPAFSMNPREPGWIRDAHETAHTSARRGIDAVWYSAFGKEWRGKVAQADAGKTVQVTPLMARVLAPLGVEWEEGSTMTGGELFDALGTLRDQFRVESNTPLNLLDRGPVRQELERHPFGQKMIDDLKGVEGVLHDNGIDTFEDWPEEIKVIARDQFSTAIELGVITKGDYDAHVAGYFGELDFKPSVPASLADIPEGAGLTFEPGQLSDGTVEVIDGDTLSLVTASGPMRVRLIGINAPEKTQQGYTEASASLSKVLRGAENVVLAVYKPELFGVTQLTAPGEERLLMWLFVDGVPIFDPSVFTADNPRGAGVGGTVLDLEAILRAGNGTR